MSDETWRPDGTAENAACCFLCGARIGHHSGCFYYLAGTRPLRHERDRDQERINLEAERDRLEERLAWVRAVLAGLEGERGGEWQSQLRSASTTGRSWSGNG